MRSVLEDVIELGWLALQSEDLRIRTSSYYRNKRGGIVHLNNERFHQNIIWSAIHPMMDSVLEGEDRIDLIVEKNRIKHFFEIKNWRDDDAPDISKEVEKFAMRQNCYFIVTSIDNPSDTQNNLTFIEEKWKNIDPQGRKAKQFTTEDSQGKEVNFWIAGWPFRPTF